mmetsp:Transcript_17487/g.12514  ORF Transcript_17487/g.12514 Transcript_17487/m.12514 type:complete len:289 (+) Transcript_17487:327-1193(+)
MELTHHTLLKEFIMDMNERHTERFENSHSTVNEDQSFSSKHEVTFTFVLSFHVDMNFKFNTVTAHDKFFVHFLDRYHLAVKTNIQLHADHTRHHLVILLHHRLLHHRLLLHDSNISTLVDIDSSVHTSITKAHKLILEFSGTEFHHHGISHHTFLSTNQTSLVEVLEYKSTAHIEPELELSLVGDQAHERSTVSINVEATGHSLFELFIVGFSERETERFEFRHLEVSVHKDKSLGGEDEMTLTLELSKSSNVDFVFNTISSHDKLFIHVSDRHEFSINFNVVSHFYC